MAILESPDVDCREHGRLVVDKWGMRPGCVGPVELRHHVLLLLELLLVLLKELTLLLLVLRQILEIQALSRLEDLQERLFKRALLIDRRIVKLTTHTQKKIECFLQIRSSIKYDLVSRKARSDAIHADTKSNMLMIYAFIHTSHAFK